MADPQNPFLPDKGEQLAMMLMGMGSGIAAAGARNQPFYAGIAPGVQAYAENNLAMRDRAAGYDIQRRNYELQNSYKQQQERMLELQAEGLKRQYGLQDAVMKMIGMPSPGQPAGVDQPPPGIRLPQPPMMGPGAGVPPGAPPPAAAPTDPSTLPGGPSVLNGVFSDAQRKFPDLSISSGARTPDQNKAVGGATDSQHLHGNAYDIPWEGKTPEQKQAILQHFQGDSRVGGIGVYPTHIHVDTRPQRTTWGALPSPQTAQGPGPSAAAGAPQMPGPPPDATRYAPMAMVPALAPFGAALTARDKQQYDYNWKAYNATVDQNKNAREGANAPVNIGPDGQPVLNPLVSAAAAAKTDAEARAKLKGEREAAYPPEWANLTGEDLRAKLPQNWRTIVDELNSHRLAMSDLPSRAAAAGVDPSKVDFISLTKQMNPAWDPRTGEQQKKFKEQITDPSTTLGQTRFSINTAFQHLDQYQDLVQAQGNHDTPLVNRILSAWNTQQGNPKFTNAEALQHHLATEVARVVKGGTLNESDVESGMQNLSTAHSWDQAKGTLQVWRHAMGARVNTINDAADAVGIPEPERNFMGKNALAAIAHFDKVQEEGNRAPDASGGNPRPAPKVAPPKEAIGHLKMNPKLSAAFDEKYGAGAAAKILGAR